MKVRNYRIRRNQDYDFQEQFIPSGGGITAIRVKVDVDCGLMRTSIKVDLDKVKTDSIEYVTNIIEGKINKIGVSSWYAGNNHFYKMSTWRFV